MQVIVTYLALNMTYMSHDHSTMPNKSQQQLEPYHYHHESSTAAQSDHILSLLDSGHSAHGIPTQTGVSNDTISRLHSRYHLHPKKPSGGCPSQLSEQGVLNLLALKRLRMLSRWPKLFRMPPANPSQHTLCETA
jgi:hypothetical protein